MKQGSVGLCHVVWDFKLEGGRLGAMLLLELTDAIWRGWSELAPASR